MSYTYTQTGAKTGTLVLRNEDKDLTFLLTFADRTSGSSRIDDADLADLNLTFELEGRPAAVTPEPPAADEAPSTPTGYAPASLESGMTLSIPMGQYNGQMYGRVFEITSPTTAILGSTTSGSVKYTRLSDNKAEFHFTGGNLDLKYTIDFTSPTEGSVTDQGAGTTYSFTLKQGSNTPPSTDTPDDDSSSSGDSSDSEGTTTGYAPTSLDGYYFATSNYSSINGIREIGFAGGKVTIAPANVSGTYTYTRSTTNGNEAKLTLDCTGTSHDSNGELTLTYTSDSTLRLSGKINGSSYNLELNMARGSVNIEEEEEDTPSTPEVDTGDPVYGFAPSSLSSNVLELAIPTRNVSKLGFSYSDVVLAPIGATSKYKYERLGDGKAKLTITSSASTYAGSLDLQFSSPTEVKVTGQIGGIDIDCQASLSPGSISSDEFTPPAGGWAPESLTGSAMRFGNLYSFTSATSGVMGSNGFTYTYEKTGDNTAVIKITAPNIMMGLRFPDKSSYTLKFTSATEFLYSGTHSYCVGYPAYEGSVQYTAEKGTYEP